MGKRRKSPPSYRLHRASGQAVVTLSGRDFQPATLRGGQERPQTARTAKPDDAVAGGPEAHEGPQAGVARPYSQDTYRRAIVRACEELGIPKWTPHRLRHNAATQLRKEFGLDAARVVLGHTGVDKTAIYAEIDQEKAAKAMWKLGQVGR